jgi:phosphonate transport system permease protein
LTEASLDMAAKGGVAPTAIPSAPTKSLSATLFDLMLWGGLAIILIASFGKVDMQNFGRLFSGSSNISTYGADLLRPDWGAIFPPGDFWTSFTHVFTQPTTSLAGQMWLTVQIALWGTFLAVFIALPLSLMACAPPAPASCMRSSGESFLRWRRCGPRSPCIGSNPTAARPRCWA